MAPLLRRQIDIARRIRAGEHPEKIFDEYRREGVAKEHIDFVLEAVKSSMSYFPPHQWTDRKSE